MKIKTWKNIYEDLPDWEEYQSPENGSDIIGKIKGVFYPKVSTPALHLFVESADGSGKFWFYLKSLKWKKETSYSFVKDSDYKIGDKVRITLEGVQSGKFFLETMERFDER